MDVAHLADLIGSALTDLLVSRHEQDIFSENNRRRVAAMAAAVHEELERRVASDPLASVDALLLSEHNLTDIIERALIRHNQHDIARSLVVRHRHATLAGAPVGVVGGGGPGWLGGGGRGSR